MILTKESLRSMLENMWLSIPESLEEELIANYGHPVVDGEGHMREYTEQDIYEQVRKKLIHEGYSR